MKQYVVEEFDCISRSFAPKLNVPENPGVWFRVSKSYESDKDFRKRQV